MINECVVQLFTPANEIMCKHRTHQFASVILNWPSEYKSSLLKNVLSLIHNYH